MPKSSSSRINAGFSESAVRDVVDVAVLALVTAGAFSPILRNEFVNWDDPTVLLQNPHLSGSNVIGWAFSTTLIGHYQPLSWLVWSGVASWSGLSASAFHALSLATHIANGALVYLLVRRLLRETTLESRSRMAAMVAGAVFLLHPTSVETVAWASAFPYVLSLLTLLLSFMAYVNGRYGTSIVCFAVSLLSRATALGFPIMLFAADLCPLAAYRRKPIARLIVEKIPFAVLALAAAVVEWTARDVASLQEVSLGARLTFAATAPFVYLRHIAWPFRLSLLNVLPATAVVEPTLLAIAVIALIAITSSAWMLRRRWPWALAAWTAYLVLLLPVAGLTPSGLQLTADRYLYVPMVVVSMIGGIGVAQLSFVGSRTWRMVILPAAAVATVVLLGVLSWRQTQYWHDSVALWTRTLDLDPRNDVASYNLAVALADLGREDEAIVRYEQTLALVPDHDLARLHLAALKASRAEREGDRLAASGNASDAIELYTQTLNLDSTRRHARAARGVLLTQRGRFAEAASDLRMAIDEGAKDVEVSNALAYALMSTGRAGEAAHVLEQGLAAQPGNINLEHNLARLLATAPDARVRDGERAVHLALDVCERTGNRDARTLDTLAAAYAEAGRMDLARTTASRAIAIAQTQGDQQMAAEIAARAGRYRR
jgi:Flp pilus assembly protein TadD